MVLTQAATRRLLYVERLAVWGVHMRETYTPGKHCDGQPSARPVYHYPSPVLHWLADITEAFAALAPDTPARGMRFSTLTQLRFNLHQKSLWLFYVAGLGDLTDTDRALVTQMAGETRTERAGRDWKGDGRVGQRLGVGGRQANRLRCEAVGLLAQQLAWKWDREDS